MFLKREDTSFKGENGRVMVLGGNDLYHGAPILSALAAEATGVDLVYVMVPPCHGDVTKHASCNFICDSFKMNFLTGMDVFRVQKMLKKADVLVIGPGLGEKMLTMNVVYDIIRKTSVPTVIDASALLAVKKFYDEEKILPANCVITPHRGEFEKITGKSLTGTVKQIQNEVQDLAKKLETIVLLKGAPDIIANSENSYVINKKGNAGLTVGGTGDTLSGVIGGLIAQKIHPFDACKYATRVMGECAEILFQEKGFAYRAVDIIQILPNTLFTMTA